VFKTRVKLEGWDELRELLVDRALIAAVITSVVAVAASLSRIVIAGPQPSMLAHLAVYMTICLAVLMRKRLPLSIKINLIVGLSVLTGVVSILDWGVLSTGVSWLLISTLLITLIYGTRIGLLAGVLAVCFIITVGLLFVTDQLQLPTDANAYAHSPLGWFAVVASILPQLAIIIILIGTLYEMARPLMNELVLTNERNAELAERDPLTDLANPRLMRDRLRHALHLAERDSRPVFVMYMDVDRFKSINDEHGHAAGDQVLKIVAERLSSIARTADTVARIGGDEFVVILESATSVGDADAIARRILEQMSEPYFHDERELKFSVSIGLSTFSPGTYLDASAADEKLLADADAAMYLSKREGGNRYHRALGRMNMFTC